MKTYLTLAEATIFYPRTSDYTSATTSGVLDSSFGMVNSYLDSKLAVPQLSEWDGVDTKIVAPEILKYCQARMFQYQLEFINIGWSQELEDFYNSTISILKGITQNEIGLPGSLIGQEDIGWNIIEVNCSGLAGNIYLDSNTPPPAYHTKLKILVTSAGTKYVASGVTFSVYSTSASTPLLTNQTALYTSYNTVTDTNGASVSFRWDGQWTTNDTIYINGVPQAALNVLPDPSKMLRQQPITYNPWKWGC